MQENGHSPVHCRHHQINHVFLRCGIVPDLLFSASTVYAAMYVYITRGSSLGCLGNCARQRLQCTRMRPLRLRARVEDMTEKSMTSGKWA